MQPSANLAFFTALQKVKRAELLARIALSKIIKIKLRPKDTRNLRFHVNMNYNPCKFVKIILGGGTYAHLLTL